jgi:hypothetical protein
VTAVDGAQTVMSGIGGRPLLVLNRVGKGRVALLASDQAWLWDRGFEGGGPQLELLRRLAHWMMKEPELEEEALTASAQGQTITITRNTLADKVGEVSIAGPGGETAMLPMKEVTPGVFQGVYQAPEIGLYRLAEGKLESVIAVGPAAPREFEETIASPDKLMPVIAPTGGGALHLSDGMPVLREVRPGRPAAGRGWIGITPRGAYVTADISVAPILPPWAWLALAAAFIVAAWLLEGRRIARKGPAVS